MSQALHAARRSNSKTGGVWCNVPLLLIIWPSFIFFVILLGMTVCCLLPWRAFLDGVSVLEQRDRYFSFFVISELFLRFYLTWQDLPVLLVGKMTANQVVTEVCRTHLKLLKCIGDCAKWLQDMCSGLFVSMRQSSQLWHGKRLPPAWCLFSESPRRS